jgi:hypothetical protein
MRLALREVQSITHTYTETPMLGGCFSVARKYSQEAHLLVVSYRRMAYSLDGVEFMALTAVCNFLAQLNVSECHNFHR